MRKGVPCAFLSALVMGMFVLALSAPLAPAQAFEDVTGRVDVTYSGYRLNRTTGTYDTLASIKNVSIPTCNYSYVNSFF